MLKKDEMAVAGVAALNATALMSTDEKLTEIWDFMQAVLNSPNSKQSHYFEELAGHSSSREDVNVTAYEADQIELGLALITNVFRKWDV